MLPICSHFSILSSIQFIGLAGYGKRPDVIGGMRNYKLVELEMGWTVNWFKWREKQWMERLQQVQDDERAPGMDSYCHKQVALWTTLAKQANE